MTDTNCNQRAGLPATALALLFLGASALAGCGQTGALYQPPAAEPTPETDAEETGAV